MTIIDRVKNILLTPKTEWPVIDQEPERLQGLLTKFVLPLLILGAIANFIGYAFSGVDALFVKIKGVHWGLSFAIRYLVSGLIGFLIATYVVDALAPSFSSEKNLNKSAQLVAYSNTPAWLAAVFMVVPTLAFFGLIGLYGIYLFYIGLPVLKKTPEDKRIAYMIVAALVIIVVGVAVQWAVGLVLNMILGNPYADMQNHIKSLMQ
jgi:hypothetical protein